VASAAARYGWMALLNEAQTELQALCRSVKHGQPYGEVGWVEATAKRLGLEQTLRPLGRPRAARKQPDENERMLFG